MLDPLPRLSLLFPLALALAASCRGVPESGSRADATASAPLVGFTIGAVAGEAASGIAGSTAVRRSDRPGEITDASAPGDRWPRLDDLVGNWRCSIWGLDAEGNRTTARATWSGEPAGASAVKLRMLSFDARGFDDEFDASLRGSCRLSYTPGDGYEMRNAFTSVTGDQHWVGEKASADEEIYNFYFAGSSEGGTLGIHRSGTRVELQFIGRDVFLIDTYVSTGRGEEQIQSYRFTRTP